MHYHLTTAWRMRERRKMLGFTLKTVAERAGCTAQRLSQLENEIAMDVRPAMKEAIAKALNCESSWLFGGNIYHAPKGFYEPMHKHPGKQ
ncbi:MAG: helix-turn-helix XRE-family like protein [Caudoviricetes sp.]|nr:MAG: helix-turn-helix XRE-family like protein [Caudoviricetes sp.]